MSASTPWSVKGIDAKARSVAKELARRSGMTLGEWLNQMILEGRDVSAELAAGLDAEHEPVAQTRRQAAQSVSHQIEDDDFAPAPIARLAGRSANVNPARNPDRRIGAVRAERDAPELQREVRRDLRREALPQSPSADADITHVARALETLGSRLESSETRSAQAVRGVSQAVEALLGRLERSEERVAEQERVITDQVEEVLASVEHLSRTEEDTALAIADRLSKTERRISAQDERVEGLAGLVREDRARFEQLETAIEAAKTPEVPEALVAVEGALGSLANQLYEDKARAQASISDVRQDMVSLSHRLAQIELRDPQKDAQALIDQVVSRMAQRLESAEARTQASIRGLEQAFSSLDARLIKAERSGAGAESTQSLAKLAGDLSQRMDEARSDMLRAVERATHAKQIAAGPPAAIESHLNAIAAQVAAVEKRSARALEQMGQDVVRIAENLNRRVNGVEAQAQATGERLSSEVSQLAARTEARLENSTTTHANALERLGGEIARISERLNAKISDAEKRSSLALGDIHERLEQGQGRVSDEIADRIRASEERTQKLLEEARRKIDTHLGEASLASIQPKPAPVSSGATGGLPSPFAASAPASETAPERTLGEDVRRSRLTASLTPEAEAVEAKQGSARNIGSQPFSALPSVFDDKPPLAHKSETAEALAADPFAALTQKPAARQAASEDVDITGRLLSGLTDFVAKPQPEAPANVMRDAFGEAPADPFAALRDDDDDVEYDADLETVGPASSADPFAEDDAVDDFDIASEAISTPSRAPLAASVEPEDDPFADIDLTRKTAPRVQSAAREDQQASAFDDIFDRDLDVPSSVTAQAFDDDLPKLDALSQSGGRVTTREALMSARAAVQASLDGGQGEGRKLGGIGFSTRPKASSPKASTGDKAKGSGSLLNRLIKTSSVSVAAISVMVGGALVVQSFTKSDGRSHIPGVASGPIPGGTEEGVPYAAVLTEAPSAQQADGKLTQEDRVADLYERAQVALKARDTGALARLQTVANLGHTTAQFELGLVYDGKRPGYPTDKKLARQWYTKAADNGSVEAMYNLAMMYYAGEGGKSDFVQSANLFRRAADRGFRNAQFNLASLYLQGRGVSENPTEAYKWFLVAARDGDTDAAQQVRDLADRLSESQRSLAESEASRFKPMAESPVIVAQN